ncbi:MAG: hypothetical protein O2921_10545 [Chloroflexi bacterium]|nr:hypothetical protein [Chloroflexota bacterium]MDA1283038.1 hypothetical protein [Chloroflexota bacterium]
MLTSKISALGVPPTHEALLASMNRAADLARYEILNWSEDPIVSIKSDRSPVTDVDLRADEIIQELLTANNYGIPVFSEEGWAIDPQISRYWTVDPIDGTISFIRNIPLYAILLGLVWDHVPSAGLIDLPALGMRMTGVLGRGCFLDGKRVTVSQTSNLSNAMISHGDVSRFDVVSERIGLEKLGARVPMRRGYTDGFGYLMTIAGRVDLMIDVDINPWESVPIRLLTKEAGGRVATKTFDNGTYGVIFGAPELVPQVIDLMKPGWELAED